MSERKQKNNQFGHLKLKKRGGKTEKDKVEDVLQATPLLGEGSATVSADGGSATMPLKALFNLIQQTNQSASPVRPFLISGAAYKMEAVPEYAKMHVRYEVRILVNEWLTVPLLSNKVAVTSAVITSIRPEEEAKGSSTSEDEQEAVSCIGVVNHQHALVVNLPGDYIVELDVLVPYTSTRGMGVLVDVPEAAQTELVFTIAKTNLELKVEPLLSMLPGTGEDSKSSYDASTSTAVFCQLPPSKQFSIQWTEKIVEVVTEKQEEVKEKLPLTVTAEQQTLHSIGEGIISSFVHYTHTILNGSVSLLEVEIDGRVRILNVSGKGVKRFEVVEAAASSRRKKKEEKKKEVPDGEGDGASPAATAPQTEPLLALTPLSDEDGHDEKTPVASAPLPAAQAVRVIKVYLEYGIEEKSDITIISELEMSGTSSKIFIPTFRSVGLVSREKGFIGVEARTNVEVNFVKGGGFASIDTTELPPKVWGAATQPLILAYKFLDPRIYLEVEVIKHADVNVLVAVIEEAHVVMTQTTEGRLLTKVVAQVRNTQQQFLRLTLPTGSAVWSTVVAGDPVKPAQDHDQIMIPMKKTEIGTAASAGQKGNSFRVEFVYFHDSQKNMAARGRLRFDLPKFDLPCNQLCFSLYIPNDYGYGEFEGKIKEVKRYSKSPLSITASAPSAPSAYGGVRNQITNSNVYRQDSRRASLVQNFDEDFQMQMQMPIRDAMPIQRPAGGKGKALGVLPVQIEIPTEGRRFIFEQLLVAEGSTLHVSVDYREENRKGCCGGGRRRAGGGGCCSIQ